MIWINGLLASRVLLLLAPAKTSTQKVSAFSTWGMWIMIGVMIVVFYLLLIRPQRKRSQEHDKMVTEMRRGDEVVTIGGIIGTITKSTEDTTTLEVDKGVSLTFTKSAISRRVSEPEPEEPEQEEEEEPEPGTEQAPAEDTEEEEKKE